MVQNTTMLKSTFVLSLFSTSFNYVIVEAHCSVVISRDTIVGFKYQLFHCMCDFFVSHLQNGNNFIELFLGAVMI